MYAVPLYFQVTTSASDSLAGAHLVPAVVGNAIGGILTGLIIKKSGRYKGLLLFGTISSTVAYLLLYFRWHGHTNWIESLYIFPGGFGTGVALAATFIVLNTGIHQSDYAVASAGLYLSGNVGAVLGLAATSSTMQSTLRAGLESRLNSVPGADNIIKRVISDIGEVRLLPEGSFVRNSVVASYVESIGYTHLVSLACALAASIVALFIKEEAL
jgi:hypothetical protein